MKVEILAIGNEILRGYTINTNAAYLAQKVAELGLHCHTQTVVGDGLAEISGAIQTALARSDILFLTGGLGPTQDDCTLQGLALAINKPLKTNTTALRWIKERYAEAHRECPDTAWVQADLPEGAEPLANRLGSACGVWLQEKTCTVIALPGVPYEMQCIFDEEVHPRLAQIKTDLVYAATLLRCVGIVELAIEAHIKTLNLPEFIEVGLYPQLGAVDIRLSTRASTQTDALKALAPFTQQLQKMLEKKCYATEPLELSEIIGNLLVAKKEKLALAESCTGGLIAKHITDSPGSSAYFLGGVVAYDNAIKENVLGVPAALLEKHGAVSAEVAQAMAEGVLKKFGADHAISITGIAGPSGGTDEKPLGLVYIGYANRHKSFSEKFELFGDRERIRVRAMRKALNLLYLQLLA